MGSTLEHGIYLPSEGEKNCYQGLAGNWNKVDGALGDVAGLKQLIESKFTKEVVTELPTEDINPYCIYMILKIDPETNNIYDEWVYINNAWEYLGNTQVDMTQYYTKQEVNELPAVASGVTSTKVGNYDAHIANGDIHVTASDKAKWNTVALIKQLRLVNTQVGSATTIAFANIDDTNGIKVGDKCMDLDAKMFEITAVDATNETVTVGSALIDLALDANVMHLSGNETASGQKTFSGLTTFNSGLYFTNSLVTKGTIPQSTVNPYRFYFGSGVNYGASLFNIDTSVSNTGVQSFIFRSAENVVSGDDTRMLLVYDPNRSQPKYIKFKGDCVPDANKTYECGTSTNKWKTFNGINPGALSLPDLDNGLDISGYITRLDKVVNNYTPPANGWLSIRVKKTSLVHASLIIYQTGGLLSSCETTEFGISGTNLPVIANKNVEIYIYADSLASAIFYPCQGNV